jgi:hypothetical protein
MTNEINILTPVKNLIRSVFKPYWELNDLDKSTNNAPGKSLLKTVRY